MMRDRRRLDRAVDPNSERAAPSTAFLLPSLGTVLAVVGLLLLLGAVRETSSASPTRRGETHAGSGDMLMTASPKMTRASWAHPNVEPLGHLVEARHEAPRANVAHEASGAADWDLRWDLIEMASAQRGQWGRTCPCPIYAVEHPTKGPR